MAFSTRQSWTRRRVPSLFLINGPQLSRSHEISHVNINANHPEVVNQSRVQFTCDHCGKGSHSSVKCYSPGGGLGGHWTWSSHSQSHPPLPHSIHTPSLSRTNHSTHKSVQYLDARTHETAMAVFTPEAHVLHTWDVDTAAARHMSGNSNLFQSVQCTDPVMISIGAPACASIR
jgi:hypothetical protein